MSAKKAEKLIKMAELQNRRDEHKNKSHNVGRLETDMLEEADYADKRFKKEDLYRSKEAVQKLGATHHGRQGRTGEAPVRSMGFARRTRSRRKRGRQHEQREALGEVS
jgi:hypothetical protein